MWCFVDESWSPDGYTPRFGVICGVLILDEQLPQLDDFVFATRRKYFGKANAKDRRLDLKGKDMLSNHVLRLWSRTRTLPRNICVVKEILGLPHRFPDFYMRVFASTVFTSTGRHPALVSPDPKSLAIPFKSMIENVSRAAREYGARSVDLVFDQRVHAQTDIAIAIANFVAGMGVKNVRPYPYFAVSNVSPGVQVADIFGHLLAKQAQGVRQVRTLYAELRKLQWQSTTRPRRYGLNRFSETSTGGVLRYKRVR